MVLKSGNVETCGSPERVGFAKTPYLTHFIISGEYEEDVLESFRRRSVALDSHIALCGPCQFMVPVLNEVSASMKDKIQVVKIDTEKYTSVADKYIIEALSTFIIFKDGEPYDCIKISAVNCNCANLSSDHNFYRYEAIKRLIDFVDDAITEYLTFGNPKSCCDKLGHLLTHGLLDGQFEPKEEKSKQQFWLHLFHHLSLSAYTTTLASAYKIHESDLLALDPNKLQLEAFERSRTSAAYALLLAGATHHLFVSESSLIKCICKFTLA
ncbi:hypothetical protein LOK49_LG05G02714 [Camellia lanceoleosa]|uniref:Uncharacterized protein n=1 Tax=Camellia lanceoleosa TaxID=1840588 RepID=A0ACC0HSD0_9ERIC|nr:hypothetical protein LOK49_LG05G02714 [Camellia lanceoleosa]